MPNTILKRWNGTAFEELYPKTTVEQISASGTANSSTFLRGDGTWATPVDNTTDNTKLPLTGGEITGGLIISGSINSGGYELASGYEQEATNLILKGDSLGRSGIFFQSEKDGTNINHSSDFGFIQFFSYGVGGSSGESNELVIGTSNDADDHLILNVPNNTGIKARIGESLTDYSVYHDNYHPDADKLTTARTINVSTGASGTATSFDGSANISIPITGVSESYLTWGGKHLSGQVTPVGMSLSNEHSANRLAFINGDSLYFEYSSDAGSTWTDYGYSAATKSQFCTTSVSVPIGRTTGNYTVDSRTRITLTAQNGTTGYVYTNPRKMLLEVSTSGGMNVLVETRTGTNYQSGGAWTTFGTYSLSGWSGWNDIPLVLGTLGGGTTQTGNNWQLRLTFIMTSVNASYPTTAHVNKLRIFGENTWSMPSTLAATNDMYTYDMSQNVFFPASIRGTTLISTVGTGTAPLTVTSTTAVTNLNADLLDGLHSSSFLTVSDNNYTRASNAINADFNSYTANSDVTSISATANAPGPNGWYNLINIRHRGGTADGNLYGGQIAFGMNANKDVLGFRSHDNGSWNAWRKIWHSENDGSGSGLDADLLDNKHASDFLLTTTRGAANGVAPLGSDSKVPLANLPDFLTGAGKGFNLVSTLGSNTTLNSLVTALGTLGGSGSYESLYGSMWVASTTINITWTDQTTLGPVYTYHVLTPGDESDSTSPVTLEAGDIIVFTKYSDTGGSSGDADDEEFTFSIINNNDPRFANYLPLTGGTLTGDLTLSSTLPKLYLTDTDSNSDFSIWNNNGTFSVRDETNSSMRLTITSSGNVGIGTTSPNANLSLVTTTNTTPPGLGSLGSNFLMTKSDGGPNGNYGLLAGVSGGGWSWFQAQRVDGTATAYALNLQPSGGNVGIGTTSPENKLHIDSGTTVNIAQFENNYGKTFINGLSSSINEIVSRNADNTTYQDLNFRSQVSAQLYLNTSGNVGIGTTTPNTKLQVLNSFSVVSSGDTSEPDFEGLYINISDTSNDNVSTDLFFVENSGLNYGARFKYDGALNKFSLFRHDNSTAGSEVFYVNRNSDDVIFNGNIAVSGTVDGVDIATFKTAYDSHTHSTGFYSSASTSNLDTLYTTGQFGWIDTTTGRPESYGQGINIVSSGTAHNNTNNWITQLAFGTSTTSSYFRTKVNTGSWSAWRKIWNDANDGSGSGLDADLLDGYHASSFMLASGMSSYAPLASPALTGTPTAPTATAGTNTTQIATTAFVSTAVANLIASAPGALDTLDELAAALGDDANFASTVTNSIATKLPLAGGTLTGNLTIEADNPILTVNGADTGNAIIRANGDSQGTGAIEVGQSSVYGGGISYNGDGSPGFVTGESADHITFYRLNNGIRTEVFHYPYNSDVVNFNSTPTVGGTNVSLSGHTHTISDVTNLQTTLDGKAATSHTHIIADVTNLQTSLDGKASLTGATFTGDVFAPRFIANPSSGGNDTSGAWGIADYDDKLSAVRDYITDIYYPIYHTGNKPAIADVTNLQTTLDSKAAASHTHAISDVTNLQTSLDAKAADADVVKLTGTQSVGGVKTFTSTPVFDSGATVGNSSGTISDSIYFNTAQTYTGPYIRGSVQGLQRGYYLSQYTIWDEGNDGAGSGLDADLLDGNHASAFALSSHTHAATDITSGTVATARLGSGTADTTTYLRGDNTWSTAGIATYSTATLYVKRIYSRTATSGATWTERYDAGTGTGTTVSTTATWTAIALGYTPSTSTDDEQFLIEFSNSTSTDVEKGICMVGYGTFSSTAGMSVISYDAYETIDGTQLKIAKYYAQWRLNGSNIEFRYGSKMTW